MIAFVLNPKHPGPATIRTEAKSRTKVKFEIVQLGGKLSIGIGCFDVSGSVSKN